MTKSRIITTLAVVALFGFCTSLMAQVTDTASQTVTVTVEEIAQLAVSDQPGTLTITNADTTAGSLPPAVTEATTSLAWTSNVSAGGRNITAELDTDTTAGLVLSATVADPGTGTSSGSSAGKQALSTTAATLFSGITNENCSGATITYEASLTTMIAPIASESHTVTWTLTAGAA